MIPYFGDTKQKELVDYLEQEIEQADEERQTLLDDMELLNDVYEGRVTEKTFPFDGCSNIQVPLISTHVDALFANMMNSIFQHEPYWTVRPLVPNIYKQCQMTEWFLQYVSNHVLKMYEVCQDWFKPCVMHGTSVVTINWREEYRWRYRKVDEDFVSEPKLMYRGPKVEYVELQDFHIPSRCYDIQSAPWVGHDFYLTWPEIVAREQLGEYKDTKKIKYHPDTDLSDQERSKLEGGGIDVSPATGVYKLRSVHVLWDVKNDGKFIPITIIYHPDTRTVLALDYYAYDHCRWNYAVIRYMPKPRFFYGVGVAHMLRYMQEGLDNFINNIIDNTLVANTRFFKARQNAVQGGDDIYPGKVFWCDNPAEDLIAEQLGSTYGDITQYLSFMERWAQLRDSLTEYTMGQESSIAKTKTTATSTLALIQQSNRRFDLTLKDIRNASMEVGYQILELYQQFTKDGTFKYILPELQTVEMMQAVMEMDLNNLDFRENMLVELSASRASLNRETEKVNNVNLMNTMNGYYKQILELGQLITNPQVPPAFKEIAVSVAEASKTFSERILDSFEIPDTNLLIPSLGEAYAKQQQQIQLQQAAGQQGAPGASDMGPNPAAPAGLQGPAGAGSDMQAMQRMGGVPGPIQSPGGYPMVGGPGGPGGPGLPQA